MTEFVTDAQLDIYYPGNFGANAANLTISQGDIAAMNIKRRTGVSRDLAAATVNDTDGSHYDNIRSGSKVEFKTQLRSDNSLQLRFVGFLQEYNYTIRGGDHPNRTTLDCDGIVAGILSNRVVTNAWDGVAPSVDGANNSAPYDGVLNQIIEKNAPELTQTGVEVTQTPFGDGISMIVQQRDALELVHDIERRAGALLGSDGIDVLFKDVGETVASEYLGLDDFHLPLGPRVRGDEMATSVRIDAGQGSVIGAEQTDQATTITVNDVDDADGTGDNYTKSDGEGFFQDISLNKPELLKVNVWTDRKTDNNNNKSQDSLTLRIQRRADGGTGAVAENDRGADIVRATKQPEDLTEGGYTTFEVEADSIPTELTYLLEANGDDGGQLVGAGGSNNDNLTHKSFVPIPLDARAVDSEASDQYVRREVSLARRDQSSRAAVKQQARAVLKRRNQPRAQIRAAEAASGTAHDLVPLDVVNLNFEGDPIGGDWVVTTKDIQYGGGVQQNHQRTLLDFTKLNVYE